jgi:hypothetical protein
MGSPLRLGLAILSNIKLGWKGFPGTNILAYFRLFINDEEKQVYIIHSWCQCCKPFFLCR